MCPLLRVYVDINVNNNIDVKVHDNETTAGWNDCILAHKNYQNITAYFQIVYTPVHTNKTCSDLVCILTRFHLMLKNSVCMEIIDYQTKVWVIVPMNK